MPEGHTIHRLARDLGELSGRRVRTSSPQGRFNDGAAALDGCVVERPDAHGKHLFLHVHSGDSLHVHLGMHGKWFRYPDPATPPMKQTRLRVATDEVAWDLVAPGRCEVLTDDRVGELLAGLGPDPLRGDADREAAVAAIASSHKPIGAVLLDQSVVAGVGNVFRNEALHQVGTHPSVPASSLPPEVVLRLWDALQQMMSQAVEDGRIITVDGPDRLLLPESETRHVYRQQRCRDCGSPVEILQVGGRTAYICPAEQALP